ncbi:LacI family DNA-binding transcriptional regulator [Cohnella sp. CFH 77786]|uniref:LacI family DNA-binding transcriptional regulator n=1 Tax=Cohnella sp. CFH 77786 TaxID=2662265 RepID=UPI001C60A947|nr:LacI family DNA-binding transcriptional regulator [Cohnella sp. CFH 77786]MBW5445548.1 LacI family DNA-binding transcriptional regulator [Cohnella sp. CFH 77786]
MKPTIYDIARIAEVSTATVSKVLNNNGRISEKTRKRILKIMEDLQYQPNVLASAMKGKFTYQIALLIPDIDNPIYAQYLKHIEERGQGFGFSIVMCSTDNNPEKEARHVSLMLQKRVDGFIIASKFKNEELLNKLLKDKVPVVLFAYEKPELLIDSVTADDFLGGIAATDHLVSLGHRRIAMIAEDSYSGKERLRGYMTALRSAGIEPDESLVIYSGAGLEDAEETGGRLLDVKERPSAIFGCNDIMAVGAVRAARKRGLAVPDELSVIGFDNTALCTVSHPELTSISMPVSDLGQKVMEVIVDKIEGKDKIKQRIRLFPELVVRGSTAQKR